MERIGQLGGIGVFKGLEEFGMVQDVREVVTPLIEVIEPSQELGCQLRDIRDPGS